jgi:hypothetical protein
MDKKGIASVRNSFIQTKVELPMNSSKKKKQTHEAKYHSAQQ